MPSPKAQSPANASPTAAASFFKKNSKRMGASSTSTSPTEPTQVPLTPEVQSKIVEHLDSFLILNAVNIPGLDLKDPADGIRRSTSSYSQYTFHDESSAVSAGQTTVNFSSDASQTSVHTFGDNVSSTSNRSVAPQPDAIDVLPYLPVTKRQMLQAIQMKEALNQQNRELRRSVTSPIPAFQPPPVGIDLEEERKRREQQYNDIAIRSRDETAEAWIVKSGDDKADAWIVDDAPGAKLDASVAIAVDAAAAVEDEDADPYLILPCAPSDEEKMMYLKTHKYWLYGYMLFSFLGTQVGLWLFIKSSVMFYGLSIFAGFTAVYLGISIFINLAGRNFSYEKHLEMVNRGPNVREEDLPTVDVFLPCCGEPLSVLRNTYEHVRVLDWPNLKVHVLDDGAKEEVRELAAQYGFNYIRRDNRPYLKKAGNLRHAFGKTDGEFFVIFDADFCPRSDMLREVMPYMIHDPTMGIVQTPQFFRLRPNQSWVEKGAALSQELFYRLIQVSRDHFGGSICVGTCAVYRREPLVPHGGTAEVEHSEDVHTGFLVVTSGWKLKYIPVNLAMGICPNEMQSFFNQQYRWGSGSTSLLGSMHFWQSKITFVQRLCFMSGMFYYAATAMSIFLNPIPGLLLLCLRPDYIRWYNLAFALPSVIGGTLVSAFWCKQKFGLYILQARVVQYYAHLFAIKDMLFNTRMGWVPTGGKVDEVVGAVGAAQMSEASEREKRRMLRIKKKRSSRVKFMHARWTCIVWKVGVTGAIFGTSIWRGATGSVEWYNLVPVALLTILDVVMHWNIIITWNLKVGLRQKIVIGKSPAPPAQQLSSERDPSPSSPQAPVLMMALSHRLLCLGLWMAAWAASATALYTYPTFNSTALPDMVGDAFTYRKVLSSLPSQNQTYTFYWKIEPGNTLHVTMLFRSNGSFSGPYIAMGFGKHMLMDANFVFCHQMVKPDGAKVYMNRHNPVNGYESPEPRAPGDTAPLIPIDGGMPDAGSFFCEWSIPAQSIPPSQFTNMIWALNAFPLTNPKYGTHTSYHNMCDWCRGTGAMDWFGGVYTPGVVSSYQMKEIHGFGMALVWLIIFPSMAFYSRFGRSRLNWIQVHYSVQGTGFLLVFVFLGIILSNVIDLTDPHAGLGITLIVFLVIQVAFGVMNRMKLFGEHSPSYVHFVKIAHAYLGVALMIGSVVQGYYNPFASKLKIDDMTEDDGFTGDKRIAKTIADRNPVCPTLAYAPPVKELHALEAMQQGRRVVAKSANDLKVFTWADVNAEVNEGTALVVANGKYVYDATIWLNSHPGGKVAISSVAGTDISFDFFRDSGFDAEDFKPSAAVRVVVHDTLPRHPDGRVMGPATLARQVRPLSQPIPANDRQQHSLTMDDWKMILRARRTNPHSYNAIRRLASLMVGTLATNSNPADEYKRYTVTAREIVATDGPMAPTCLLRLALLYPTRESMEEPCFQAGEAVEIQARIGDKVVSRYYTPISGSPVAFEILVKVKPGGVASRWLCALKTGDRQIKVRGPLGRRLMPAPSPERISLGLGGEVPRELFFFAGGTGIAPFLQLVNNLLLPLGATLPVVAPYAPQSADEIELMPGDVIQVYHHYFDGWGRGVNLMTGQDGMFPLTFTDPNAGPHFKLTLVASCNSHREALGDRTLRAALLSYPNQIEVHWCIGRIATAARGSVYIDGSDGTPLSTGEEGSRLCGYLYHQPLTADVLEFAVADSRSRPPPMAQMGIPAVPESVEGGADGEMTRVGSTVEEGTAVVACGPERYCEHVVALCKQSGSLGKEQVTVMGGTKLLY
ncbi:hypothetical protein HK101_006840 [Irineochytrium annulatum]|nr:hypothetical protein HK101_006840 [Irineochytrium annulatum]